MTTRRDFLKQAGSLGALALMSGVSLGQTNQTPNVIWFSCEDMGPHLNCYGFEKAITPNLDQLAREGIRYTHAFTSAGVCAPVRSGVITGMYQTSLGTSPMRCRAKLPDFVKGFPHYLRENGIYCTNNSKTDYQTNDITDAWDESSRQAHWKKRKAGQPFFAIFNYTGTHESAIFNKGKYTALTQDLKPEQRQDPAELEVPPYYPDTPKVREDQKRYYELITAMDAWVGEKIRELKRSLLYDDTIIVFWSDHGVGLPRCKRWVYDSGTHVPLIVYVPEKYRTPDMPPPGSVDDRLINSIDFGPTVMNLLNIPLPDHMHGQPFLGFNLPRPRTEVFSAKDRTDERYEMVRAVRDKRYRYIRNFQFYQPYLQYLHYPEQNGTRQEIRRVMAEGNLPPASRAHFAAESKPVEELYDLENDPHEINNLAGDPKHQERLESMRKKLRDWMMESRDVNLIPEAIVLEREKKLGSRYAITHQGDSEAELDVLLDLADAMTRGPEMLPGLIQALDDKRDSVRYWAAVGIGALGSAASQAEFALYKKLLDDSPCVRLATAETLRRMGKIEKAWPTVLDHLLHENEAIRLMAVTIADHAEAKARTIAPQLRNVIKAGGYPARVAQHTLDKLNIPRKAPKPNPDTGPKKDPKEQEAIE